MVEKSQTEMEKELVERYTQALKNPNEGKNWDDVKADLISEAVPKSRRNELVTCKRKK